jgi:type II secretory pathway component GspD/PulD (secretin)
MKIVRKISGAALAFCLGAQPFATAWAQVSPFEEGGGDQGGPVGPGGGGKKAPAPAEAPAPAAEPPAAPPAAMPSAAPGGEDVNVGALPESVESVTREPTSPLDTRVTVRVKEAPLATFLDTISAQAKVNFIIAKGLEGTKVTAFLQNVKVREALQVLLEMEGISYERVGKTNTFTIRQRSSKGPQTVTRIYTLNYISLISLAGAGAAAITPGTTGGPPPGAPSTGNAGMGGGGGSNTQGAAATSIPFLTVIQSVLSQAGKVQIEPRTNSLVITDVPETFPHIEQLISELDKKVPQVMIEAQIVEINSEKVNELGIEWGGTKGELATFVGPARLTDYPLRPGIFSGHQLGFFFPPPASTVNTQPFGSSSGSSSSGSSSSGSSSSGSSSSGSSSSGSSSSSGGGGGGAISPVFSTGVQGDRGLFYGVFSLAQLQAILRALIQRSDARFLGKPKVLTLNNQQAVIQILQKAAIGVQSQVFSSGGSTGGSSTSAERSDVGLTMTVTPQVNREGYITLLIAPTFTDVVPSQASTPSNPLFDPITRGVSTLVRVKNGQTIVLGGLLESKETKLVRKVPLLGYIPVIGWLFTSVSSDRSNTDLVIFLTPTIIND